MRRLVTRWVLAATLLGQLLGLSAGLGATPSALAAPRLAADQVLRLAVAPPSTLDPAKMNQVSAFGLMSLVFSGLYSLDANGSPVPDAAAALPEISPDGRGYTVRLRPDGVYSDGVPVTAAEFRYSVLRWLDPRVGSPNSAFFYPIAGATEYAGSAATDEATLASLATAVGVEAPDALTLRFKLAKPAAYFTPGLSELVPLRRELVERGGERWTEPSTYIGNGPFRLTVNEANERFTFEPNARYWRGAPRLQRIEITPMTDPSVAFLSYLNGELDAVEVTPPSAPAVHADPRLEAELSRVPGACGFMLLFNVTRPPVDQPALRQAIAQAIDRDTLARDLHAGLDAPVTQLVPPGQPGYFPELRAPHYDPAAARQTLADAGLDPVQLPEITFTFPAVPFIQADAEWLQGQLRDGLGLRVRLDPLEFRALSSQVGKVETFPPLLFVGYCPAYPDPQQWYSYMFQSSSTLFRTGWHSDEYDRLTRAADGEIEPSRRAELYRQAAQLLADAAPVVPLLSAGPNTSLLVRAHVKGWQHSTFDWFFSRSTIHQVTIVED